MRSVRAFKSKGAAYASLAFVSGTVVGAPGVTAALLGCESWCFSIAELDGLGGASTASLMVVGCSQTSGFAVLRSVLACSRAWSSVTDWIMWRPLSLTVAWPFHSCRLLIAKAAKK